MVMGSDFNLNSKKTEVLVPMFTCFTVAKKKERHGQDFHVFSSPESFNSKNNIISLLLLAKTELIQPMHT